MKKMVQLVMLFAGLSTLAGCFQKGSEPKEAKKSKTETMKTALNLTQEESDFLAALEAPADLTALGELPLGELEIEDDMLASVDAEELSELTAADVEDDIQRLVQLWEADDSGETVNLAPQESHRESLALASAEGAFAAEFDGVDELSSDAPVVAFGQAANDTTSA